MLSFLWTVGMVLAALAGWTTTHTDLLHQPWFRRSRSLRAAAAVCPASAALGGMVIIFNSLVEDGGVRWYAVAVATAFGVAGLVVWLTRPIRQAAREPAHDDRPPARRPHAYVPH